MRLARTTTRGKRLAVLPLETVFGILARSAQHATAQASMHRVRCESLTAFRTDYAHQDCMCILQVAYRSKASGQKALHAELRQPAAVAVN